MVAFDPSEAGYSDACLFSHPCWPRWSSSYDRLYPRQWLMGHDSHELAECRHRSTSCIASDSLEPYHHYRIGRSLITTKDAFSPVRKVPDSEALAPLTIKLFKHQRQTWTSGRTPRPTSSNQKSVYNIPGSHVPVKPLIIGIASSDGEHKWNGSSWPYTKQMTVFVGVNIFH